MKLLHLEEEFNISVETFFAFFFESSGFKQRYHTARGDTAIEVKQWLPTSSGSYSREICFCSFISNNPIINKLVGDKAKVREVQRYLFKDERALNVTSETFFEGSPIGKSFQSESEWNVVPSTTNSVGCKVSIDVKNNFSGMMFKGVLENWVHDTTEASFKTWLNLVRQQVEEYEQSEKLKRAAPPTPIKSSNGATALTPTTLNGRVIPNNSTNGDSWANHADDNSYERHSHQHQQQQQQNGWQNGGYIQEEDEDDCEDENDTDIESDFSGGPPSINEDFMNEEEESGEDQFFDSSEQWQQQQQQLNNGAANGDVKNYMMSLNNEINSMKSIIEVNHTRLLGLETAFSQLQLSRNQQQQHQFTSTAGGNNSEAHTTNTAMINGVRLSSYVSSLEELVKNHQEEEFKSREKLREWELKAKEIEASLAELKKSSKKALWFNVMGILFLVVGWPIIARKLWVHLLPLLTSIKK